MLRQGRLIAVMASLLICCAVLVSHPRGASATEDRCEGTRTIVMMGAGYKTNDVPGCPKGGLLSGTDGADYLYGGESEDDVRGLGSPGRQFDELYGGYGSDVIYGGPGYNFLYGGQDDDVLHGGDGDDILFIGGPGEDVLYGGDGNDYLDGMDCPPAERHPNCIGRDEQRDALYCGEGWDRYLADKLDYVSRSCEEGSLVDTGGPPLIHLAGVALLSTGLLLSRCVMIRWAS